MSFDDSSIDGTDFMRKDGQRIIDGYLIQGGILDAGVRLFMGNRRHTFAECLQDG